MGKEVYHYTSLEVLKKILLSKTLRFTKLNSLNDISEYKFGLQLLKDKVSDFEKSNKIINKIDLNLFDRFSFLNSLYSLSFTECGDSISFWNSHYVDKNNPISLCLVSDRIFNNNNFIINRCIYGDPYPVMGKERYQWFRDIFETKNILKLYKNREYTQITFQTAHIKHKAFEIEKEWRAISFVSKDSSAGKFSRNGKEVEYFDQHFNIDSIREIIIGPCRNQKANYEEVLSFISENNIKCFVTKSMIPLEL